MKIMISHDHREKELVTALRTLLETLSHGNVQIWYSSDARPDGGMDTGEWWTILKQRIQESHYIFAVITPSSMYRPWIQWECGGASAQENTRDIVPILYNMGMTDIDGPLAGFQAYRGDNFDTIVNMVNRTLRFEDVHINDDNIDEYKPHIDYYLRQVDAYFAKDLKQKLFDRSFHKPDKTLDGLWYATWYNDDGEVFVQDTIEIFMNGDRVQAIGHTGKDGFESEFPHYPLEGRISADRVLSMNYWDVHGFTLCGSLLLKVAGTGRKMVGKWLGWTTDDVDGVDMWIMTGKVVWSRTGHEN